MLQQESTTVNPQDADTVSVVLTAQAHKFEHVRIYQSRRRWRWQHQYADGKLATTSKESFAAPIEAALAAATVAHCEGIPVLLPKGLEPELGATWRRQGTEKFAAGLDIDDCWNRHQRQGFAAAMLTADEITLMERDLAALRRGAQRVTVRLSDEDMAAMEAEALTADWRL